MSVASRTTQVRRPVWKAPVSMPMRCARTSGRAAMVWPWTTRNPSPRALPRKGSRIHREILRILQLERQAGSDAGVDEHVLALGMHQREPREEREMARRNGDAEPRAERREDGVAGPFVVELDAVAGERRQSAVHQPGGRHGPGEEVEHHRLVVPLQVHRPESGEGAVDQPVENLARRRAAIDVIAQVDED